MSDKTIPEPVEFRYSSSIKSPYGHYECTECGAEYYPRVGIPVHNGRCTSNSWAYVFGYKELETVRKIGFSPASPLTSHILRWDFHRGNPE